MVTTLKKFKLFDHMIPLRFEFEILFKTMEILGNTLSKAFLFSSKDERVSNVHTKFHIIQVIFEFLVQFTIYSGEENKTNF